MSFLFQVRTFKKHFSLIIVFLGAKDFVGSSDKSAHSVISSSVAPYQRRGSMPCDSNVLSRTSLNGKRRNPKKILRRRSSSGAEILTPIVSEFVESTSSNNAGGSTWNRLSTINASTRHTETEGLLTKRRGSLPIEVLTIGLGKC